MDIGVRFIRVKIIRIQVMKGKVIRVELRLRLEGKSKAVPLSWISGRVRVYSRG